MSVTFTQTATAAAKEIRSYIGRESETLTAPKRDVDTQLGQYLDHLMEGRVIPSEVSVKAIAENTARKILAESTKIQKKYKKQKIDFRASAECADQKQAFELLRAAEKDFYQWRYAERMRKIATQAGVSGPLVFNAGDYGDGPTVDVLMTRPDGSTAGFASFKFNTDWNTVDLFGETIHITELEAINGCLMEV